MGAWRAKVTFASGPLAAAKGLEFLYADDNALADVSVIGLIGERGREVQEFLQEDLGDAGLARSVVVVATSDEPALMRRQAAYLTLALGATHATAAELIRSRQSPGPPVVRNRPFRAST